jgi:uncharacterized protein (UPF0335 family)
LLIAERDYSTLKMRNALIEVKSFIVMIYDRLQRIEERDVAATEHAALLAQEASGDSFDSKVVSRLVEEIGVVLASGLDQPRHS